MNHYQVIVSNLGLVHTGTSYFKATACFNDYIILSKAPWGRASGEEVVLIKNEEPVKTHPGEEF